MLQAAVSARAARFDENRRRNIDMSDLFDSLRDIAGRLSEISARIEALEGGAVSAMPVAGIRKIQLAVCDEYGVSLREMVSDRRNSAIMRARHVAYYLCRELTLRSYAEIGTAFGNRDHSTVYSMARKIEESVRDDAALRARVDKIRAKIELPKTGE